MARADYTILEVPGPGLMLTRSRFGRQLWALAKLRQHKTSKCAMCDGPLGAEAYRPMTNLGNRMERICPAHADQFVRANPQSPQKESDE